MTGLPGWMRAYMGLPAWRRCWWYPFWWGYPYFSFTPGDELTMLKEEEAALKEELKIIQEKIDELEKEVKKGGE